MSQLDLQPVLNGQLVTIRPIKESDWQDLFMVASDPTIWKAHPVPTRYKEDEFKSFFDGAIQSGSAFVFIDNLTSNVIGSSRYYGYDAKRSEMEIGWTFLSVDYWGGTYNAEIKQLMMSYAFQFVGTVVFWVGQSNTRSRKAMEKIGATLRQGVFKRALSGDIPYVIFQIQRDQYLC